MKKRSMLTLLLCLLYATPAVAETLPILHRPNDSKAPYEAVTYQESSPFASGTPLLTIDIPGILQGDCLIVTCGGERILIDGGENSRFQAVDRYLQSKEISQFDAFFLTHAHDDHRQVQEKLIKAGYTVGKVYSPYDDQIFPTKWNAYKALLQRKGIPFQKVQTGDVISVGSATLTIYRRDEAGISMNDHSAAAMLQFGQARMFLAADISGTTQHWLLEHFDPVSFKCDIYKSAHHNITPAVPAFLDALNPALVINTNTRRGSMAGDSQQAYRRLPRYYLTTGTIHLETDGNQWYVWLEPMPRP